ncbi:MAG: hypothetical protein FH751_14505 [Firmicutes bacterium]|nr:hypothetical protein [Bacillota bacterium]
MGKSNKLVQKRNKMFSLLERKLNESNSTIPMYFNENPNLKVDVKIINSKPQGFLGDKQIQQFENIDFNSIYNNLSGTYKNGDFARKDFKNCYERVKKAIKSNTGVSLNSLCAGMFGPIDNPNRGTQVYSAHKYMSFKVKDIINIGNGFKDVLENYNDTFISPNALAKLMVKEYLSINIRDYDEEDSEDLDDEISIETGARNIIFFGPPGTGKSYRMEENAKNIQVSYKNIIRTTFHPEYSYYDFVGQYKPVVGYELIRNRVIGHSGKEMIHTQDNRMNEFKKPFVYYDFVPGPFTKAIINALSLEGTKENTLLVIEEINRGNCAAIFGDIFQLLDRVNDINDNDYGKSQYQIDIPEEMKMYIKNELKWSDEDWYEYFTKGFVIPSNLFIFATMNTSDQSLFPMDSAFKRRWSMEYVNIDYEVEELEEVYLPEPYNKILWLDFIKVMNKEIVDYTETDDKQLGQWFVGNEISKSEFIGKVLSYLWFDIFRQQPEVIFKESIKTYDDIRNNYERGVLKDDIIGEMVSDSE